jgi:hypothetical protein
MNVKKRLAENIPFARLDELSASVNEINARFRSNVEATPLPPLDF